MTRLLILALALALGGCSSPVVLRNPSTGVTVDCGSRYSLGLYAFAANDRQNACVDQYSAQGWRLTGGSP